MHNIFYVVSTVFYIFFLDMYSNVLLDKNINMCVPTIANKKILKQVAPYVSLEKVFRLIFA